MKKLVKICSSVIIAASLCLTALPLGSMAAENTSMGAVQVSTYLNIRNYPSTDSSAVGELVNNDVVEILGQVDGWYQIPLNGTVAYVSSDYVRIVSADEAAQLIAQAKERAAQAAASSSNGDKIVSIAKQYIGTRYVSGGSSPSGFDCSGFTSYVYAKAGVSLPRTSSSQSTVGERVSKSNLQPGDLVFFGCGSSHVNHVGIYVGGGQFIHSPKPGRSVCIESINSAYYAKSYISASRVVR